MKPATPLTVWKKYLVFTCNGFTVFNSNEDLEFRVENYPSDPKNKVLLMDVEGMAFITMSPKRLSLQNEWQAFIGEFREAQKPLFVVRRVPSLLKSRRSLAEVYMCSSVKSKKKKPHFDYRVEGCHSKSSFTLFNRFNEVIAEVNSKQVRLNITLGGDVFNLFVQPGYDKAFVMGLIIILNHIMPSTN